MVIGIIYIYNISDYNIYIYIYTKSIITQPIIYIYIYCVSIWDYIYIYWLIFVHYPANKIYMFVVE